MKISSYATFATFALAAIILLLVTSEEAAGQSSQIKVSVDTKESRHTFSIGEQIILVITVKNNGDSTAELSQSSDARDNQVSLTDASGHSLPMTALGKKITDVFNISGPRRALRLQPGASIQIELDISQIYDLSSPGDYAVSISRFVRRPRGTAKSSPLKFAIR